MTAATQPGRTLAVRARILAVIFGFCLAWLVLEIGLRAAGFVFLSLQEHWNKISIVKRGEFRILCLGESTTAMGGAKSYPAQLEEILNSSNLRKKISVINKGMICVQTSYILDQLGTNLRSYNPDMVIAMMGINDGGDLLSFDDIFIGKSKPFLSNFRTYKLARLLWDGIHSRAKELIPRDDTSCVRRGRALRRERRYYQAEHAFARALELNPRNIDAYLELGYLHQEMGKPDRAIEYFEKAVALMPVDDEALVTLGCLYRDKGRHAAAQKILKKVIARNPRNTSALINLGISYTWTKRFPEAEEAFKKAVAIAPSDPSGYRNLGYCYQVQNKLSQAEDSFNTVLALDPKNPWIKQALQIISREKGHAASPPSMKEKVGGDNSRGNQYPLSVRNTYLALKHALDKQGSILVCMQYPLRNITPLKAIFQTEKNVIFVDNEKSFKNAVAREGYKEYFTDIFAGDFGHCTPKGNRLIAENIKNVLLREYFKARHN
ncbi:MAG: tetratricopeptide repeat protein [Chlamydiota bacterium]